MAHSQTVYVGTEQAMAAVVAVLERVLGGPFDDQQVLDLPARGIGVVLEPAGDYPGFNVAVDLYGAPDAVAAALPAVVAELAAATPWRLATRFGRRGLPLDERPAVRATA